MKFSFQNTSAILCLIFSFASVQNSSARIGDQRMAFKRELLSDKESSVSDENLHDLNNQEVLSDRSKYAASSENLPNLSEDEQTLKDHSKFL